MKKIGLFFDKKGAGAQGVFKAAMHEGEFTPGGVFFQKEKSRLEAFMKVLELLEFAPPRGVVLFTYYEAIAVLMQHAYQVGRQSVLLTTTEEGEKE